MLNESPAGIKRQARRTPDEREAVQGGADHRCLKEAEDERALSSQLTEAKLC
jgi:hypothetical protein